MLRSSRRLLGTPGGSMRDILSFSMTRITPCLEGNLNECALDLALRDGQSNSKNECFQSMLDLSIIISLTPQLKQTSRPVRCSERQSMFPLLRFCYCHIWWDQECRILRLSVEKNISLLRKCAILAPECWTLFSTGHSTIISDLHHYLKIDLKQMLPIYWSKHTSGSQLAYFLDARRRSIYVHLLLNILWRCCGYGVKLQSTSTLCRKN